MYNISEILRLFISTLKEKLVWKDQIYLKRLHPTDESNIFKTRNLPNDNALVKNVNSSNIANHVAVLPNKGVREKRVGGINLKWNLKTLASIRVKYYSPI